MDLHNTRERLATYHQASQQLNSWFTGALSLSFLRAAIDSGVLAIMDQPRTVQDIASHLHRAETWVSELCQTLYVLQIFEYNDGLYYLSSDYTCLLDPNAPLSLIDTLGAFEVFIREMEHIFSTRRPYAHLSTEDQLKVAKGKWGVPSSTLARDAFQQFSAQMPEVLDIWNTDAKHLELGCGAGRDLLCTASLYPKLEVTGVDINPATLSHVRRDAQGLGLSERVNLIHADARTLDYQEAFDTVSWSQIFFSTETRKSTLEVSHRALITGGYLLLPIQHDLSSHMDQLRASGNGLPLLLKHIYRSWGINLQNPNDIRREAEQVGFEFVRLVSVPYYFAMLLRRPNAMNN